MSTLREAAEEALRWMEHARLHLTIKERMHPDGLGLYDNAAEALRAALAQPEAPCYVGDARKHVICVCPDCVATNYREWRPASEPPEDGRRVLIWVATESGEGTFRPAYCPVGGWTSVFDGETLVAWRDINPPTEGAE